MHKILIFLESKSLNITDRALQVMDCLDKITILIGDEKFSFEGKDYLISNKDVLFNAIKIYFKAQIKRSLRLSEVNDNYEDKIGNVITIRSNRLRLKFNVGGENKNLPNSLIIEFGELKDEKLIILFEGLIELLKPIWGSIADFEIYSNKFNQSEHEIKFGYITFISKAIEVPKLSDSYICRNFLNIGSLIKVNNKKPYDPSNASYVLSLKNLVDIFRDRDILFM